MARASFAVFLAVAAAAALAQRGGRFGFAGPDDEAPMPRRDAEFHFIRLEYTDLPQFHRRFGFASRNGQGNGWWMVDWPDADNHFTRGLERLTRIDTGDPRHLRLTDKDLFDYPWIYATQTGWWGLTDEECARLREYLLRGGYIVTDDFWGDEQWETFRQTMARVLPGHPLTDLSPSDAVMHMVYDIREQDRTFIPGSRHLRRGAGGTVEVVQPEGSAPAWRAMYDDHGRMVVAANYDTDVGDAWEFADVPYYPAAMTLLAYRYGVNYVTYAMTH
ncbi:MAG TPA: DUF4159 domain-containing protein [Candidatus Limnocylindrales bacterium]|jgi:hypothetical protein|nr:DUF4159 domain-containing protein [Candidatus Limnocylindrales bacterium]